MAVAVVKKYDLDGKEVGEVAFDDAAIERAAKAHGQSIKDYLVAIRKNARQWSANTRTRAQVNRTGRKPHPQKGQGRSRQGDLAAPHYRGGGIAFGPKPKFDMHVRINRKERRAAIRSLLAEKVKANRISVLQGEAMECPRTKRLAGFLDQLKLRERRVLVLGADSEKEENLIKSLRNIPKKEYQLLSQVSGYSLALAQEVVVLEPACENLLAALG